MTLTYGFTAIALSHKRMPLIVLTPETPSSAHAPGSRPEDQVTDAARALGAEYWESPLVRGRVVSDVLAVSVIRNVVSLEVPGYSPILVRASPQLRETIRNIETIRVLLAPDVSSQMSDRKVIQRLFKTRLLAGIRAPVTATSSETDWSRQSSRYRLVGVTQVENLGFPQDYTTYHLDSNILLDMERAYRGHMRADELEDLRQVVLAIYGNDIAPGPAISELCYVPASGQLRTGRHAELVDALSGWLGYGLHGILRLDDLSARNTRAAPFPIQGSTGEHVDASRAVFEQHIDPMYASILKINQLSRRISGFKEKQRIELLKEYCDFVANDLQMVSAYALQIAIDLFVGNPDRNHYVRKLLKLPTNRKDTLVGAAWDVFHLNLLDLIKQIRMATIQGSVDLSQLGDIIGNGVGDPFLVTGDQGLMALRRQLHVIGTTNDDTRMVASLLDVDLRLQARTLEIEGILHSAMESIISRQSRDDSRSATRFKDVIRQLEHS